MMGKTHRAAGGLIALSGFVVAKRYGLLNPAINDVTELLLLYGTSYYGSIAADNDHVWVSSPCNDPLSWIINKILHLTTPIRKEMEEKGIDKGIIYKLSGVFDARHRSWQTHSELPLLIILYFLSIMNRSYEWILLLGFGLGYLSHALMDMLSSGGYHLLIAKIINKAIHKRVLPDKIRLVPRDRFFNTGGTFEAGVYRVINFCSTLLALYVVYLVVWSV